MEKYLVIVQFPSAFFSSIDEVHAFEDRLVESLPSTHVVDGHDVGRDTVNFFIYSDSFQAVLRNFRKYLGTNKVEKKVRIAYREPDTDNDFVSIWPKRDPKPFELTYEM